MTVELKNIDELFQLDAELNGFSTEKDGEVIKGLLNERLPIKVKYYLFKLEEVVSSKKKSFQETIQKCIKDLGEEDENGGFSIPQKIKAKNGKLIDNPKFAEVNKQIEDIRLESISLESKDFSIEDFNLESSSQYRLFLKRFIKDE